MTESLKIEIEGPIAQVILNRPEKANALDGELWQALGKCFRDLDQNKSVRVCILSAEGKHFTAGIDLNLLQEIGIQSEEYDCEGRKRDFLRRKILELQSSFSEFERCRKPVVAAIHGYCFGVGLEFCLACDFRIVTETALIGLPEQRIGMIPGSGGSIRLLHMIGLQRTKDMVMRSRRVTGPQACDWGIALDCVTADSLDGAVAALVKELTQFSPLAQRTSKRILNEAQDAPLHVGIGLEGEAYGRLRSSHDFREGVEAFHEKRKADFNGT